MTHFTPSHKKMSEQWEAICTRHTYRLMNSIQQHPITFTVQPEALSIGHVGKGALWVCCSSWLHLVAQSDVTFSSSGRPLTHVSKHSNDIFRILQMTVNCLKSLFIVTSLFHVTFYLHFKRLCVGKSAQKPLQHKTLQFPVVSWGYISFLKM